MEIFRLLASIISFVVIGWCVLDLFTLGRRAFHIPEKLALSFGIGLGAISLEMTICYLTRIPATLPVLVFPWLVIIMITSVIFRNRAAIVSDILFEGREVRPLIIILASCILVETVYVIFRAGIRPIESYDAIAIYAIRSKIFYLNGGIPGNYFSEIARLFPHPDYPLSIPLAETFVYMFLGDLNDRLVKVIFPLFYIGTLTVFYFSLRRMMTRTVSLLFTFILATIPQFCAYATNAYLDLPLAYYVLSSAVLLFMWLKDNSMKHCLAVSALMAGFAALTKNEGLMYCVVNLLLIMIFVVRDRRRNIFEGAQYFLGYAAILLIVNLPWIWIKRSFGIANDEIDLARVNPVFLLGQIGKLPPILYEFQRQIFGPKKWNIIWPVLICIMALRYKKVFSGVTKYVFMFIMFSISAYVLFYMISRVDVVFFVGKTWSRFLVHFLPVAIYLLAATLKDDVNT